MIKLKIPQSMIATLAATIANFGIVTLLSYADSDFLDSFLIAYLHFPGNAQFTPDDQRETINKNYSRYIQKF